MIRHAPACSGEDPEAFGREDRHGTRALIVWCRSCRARSAAPWPFGTPPPRPRPHNATRERNLNVTEATELHRHCARCPAVHRGQQVRDAHDTDSGDRGRRAPPGRPHRRLCTGCDVELRAHGGKRP